MGLHSTIVYEDGDLVYLVGPVSPIEPAASEIEEFAFGKMLVGEAQKRAPNPVIAWFGGHYVEADKPNGNGAMWTAHEIAVKSLTPVLMPVTVMHNPGTAVGVIADLAMLGPPAKPRATIETALALWEHRFPEAVEEARFNYTNGTLMQSMECLAPEYDCAECGQHYFKLPNRAERANWCEHLQRETGVRILAATTFTGTGLIYGSRGAKGADPLAHLEEFTAEVAEFHQKTRHDSQHRTPPRPSLRGANRTMEIEDSKYEELVQRPTREEYAEVVAARDKAQRESEEHETALTAAKAERDAAVSERDSLQEVARAANLGGERLSKLGTGFLAKLGPKTRERLEEQAKSLQDPDWESRLEELEEIAQVTRDLAGDATPPVTPSTSPLPASVITTPVVNEEEVARLGLRGLQSTEPGGDLTPGDVAGLFSKTAPPTLKS